MKQRRRGHYTGKNYDLPQATHWCNTRAQGTRVEPMVQHVALLATNLQGHHQSNVVIDPTPCASWPISFANEFPKWI